MKPSVKYKNCTAKGCEAPLSSIHGLDDNVTIKELRLFLEGRIKSAKAEFEADKKKLIKEVVGKCFKIVFSPEHTVLLKVHNAIIIEDFGDVDAIIIGEQIVS